MTQVVPRDPYIDEGFGTAFVAEEGGVWWEMLCSEHWKRLRPYEGQSLEVDEILRIAGFKPAPQKEPEDGAR